MSLRYVVTCVAPTSAVSPLARGATAECLDLLIEGVFEAENAVEALNEAWTQWADLMDRWHTEGYRCELTAEEEEA